MTETIDARLNKIIRELLEGGIPLPMAMTQFEKKYIAAALSRTRWGRRRQNKTQAAALLGVHRNTLGNKLRALR